MPWEVQRHNGKFRVVSKTSGKVAGTHSSEAQALRQVRALYANVPDAKGKGQRKSRK